ncbi:Extracellular matrix protein [Aspergillus sclerotialis]|uniref:Extracellular matrix protein n=1 Tax=Aspergillus sclerotialis TaxID=2070753 RepID=A0A3A3A200_9EURO|nr:Extracellular matrix protein [Aspergillus sclerotialis]
MQLFSSTLAVLACLVAFVAATERVQFTHWPTDAQPGKPATLTWKGDPNAPVTITLQEGPPGNLKDVKVLAANAQGGSYTWTPDDSLPPKSNYAFKISQNGQINYSGQIKVAGAPEGAATLTKLHKAMSTASGTTAMQNATSTQMSSTMATSESASTTGATSGSSSSTISAASSPQATDSTMTGATQGTAEATSTKVQTATASGNPESTMVVSQPTSSGASGTGSETGSEMAAQTAGASFQKVSSYWVLGVLGYMAYNL